MPGDLGLRLPAPRRLLRRGEGAAGAHREPAARLAEEGARRERAALLRARLRAGPFSRPGHRPKTVDAQWARRRRPGSLDPAVPRGRARVPRPRLHRRAGGAGAAARGGAARVAERPPGRGRRAPRGRRPRALGRLPGARPAGAGGRAARGRGAPPPRGASRSGPAGRGARRRGLARQRRPHLPRRLLLLPAERLRSRRLRAGRTPADPLRTRRRRPHPLPVPPRGEQPGLRDPDAPRGEALAERQLPDRRRRSGALLAQGMGRRAPRAGIRRHAAAG